MRRLFDILFMVSGLVWLYATDKAFREECKKDFEEGETDDED